MPGEGDAAGAEKLARRLNKPEDVLRVYSALMGRCARSKDAQCVVSLANEAAGQLRGLRDAPPIAPSLAGFAEAAAPFDEALAFDLLGEALAAANAGNLDEAECGRLAIETGVFKTLAAKNEPRALQSANALKERTASIAARAAVYQRKVKVLDRGGPAPPAS